MLPTHIVSRTSCCVWGEENEGFPIWSFGIFCWINNFYFNIFFGNDWLFKVCVQ